MTSGAIPVLGPTTKEDFTEPEQLAEFICKEA